MPLIELAHAKDASFLRTYSAVIGVPVHNEEKYIKRCLDALDRQHSVPGDYAIFLLLNNCCDGTLNVLRALSPSLRHDVYYVDIIIPKHIAHAGTARKMAMDTAAMLTRDGGIVLTTDADAVVTDDWLHMTRKHINAGVDAVSGFVRHNPTEMSDWSSALRQRTELEYLYEDLLAELNGLLDPLPHDPNPRHMVILGASLAATREAYQKCGGVPPVRCGEDRGFVAALERIDAKVRYPKDVIAYTSARLVGHADGGMAATLMARELEPELPCDELLESVAMTCKRATWRRELRQIWPASLPAIWSERLNLAPSHLDALWAAPAFGQAWQSIENASRELKRRPMTMAELQSELVHLQALVEQLRPNSITPSADLMNTADERPPVAPDKLLAAATSASVRSSGLHAASSLRPAVDAGAATAPVLPISRLQR